ncbi:phosphotransferase family protein [Rhodococcus sp. ACS1]|uniref:phosphotransferase family protein n=1 Tax=Rhodococcus sp. ACS1 TaxID=2028570 RepID=UPI0015CB2827|nr:phosphotransferase family protein [Rhodococcus sp. ACS1]
MRRSPGRWRRVRDSSDDGSILDLPGDTWLKFHPAGDQRTTRHLPEFCIAGGDDPESKPHAGQILSPPLESVTVDNVHRYLELVRTQLATTLWPLPEHAHARTVAQHCIDIADGIAARTRTAPEIDAKTFAAYTNLLPELTDALDRRGRIELSRAITERAQTEADLPALRTLICDAVQALFSSSPDTTDTTLLIDILRVERETSQAIHEAVNRTVETSEATSEQTDVHDPLTTYLQRHPHEQGQCTIDAITEIPGGYSKKTYLVELHGSSWLPDRVIVRSEKQFNVLGTSLETEYLTLQVVADAGLPVATPYHLETDPTILGGPFALFQWIEGSIIGDIDTVRAPSETFGRSMARAMAQLHSLPTTDVPTSTEAPVAPSRQMAELLDTYRRKWESTGIVSPAVQLAYDWLESACPLLDGHIGLVHCDLGCHNLLVAPDGEVAAILDWEMAKIGNPAQDLGYFYYTAVQLLPWDDFLAAYEAEGGTVPSRLEISFFRLWRELWRLTNISHAKRVIEAGEADDIGLARASICKVDELAARVEGLLMEILQPAHTPAR